MIKKNLLVGKWKFVDVERRSGATWKSEASTEAIVWEFFPDYTGEAKTIGIIVESAPANEPISLNYSFNTSDSLLRIELHTDPDLSGVEETDVYKVTQVVAGSDEQKPIVLLSVIDPHESSLQSMRYTLQKM
ncbi:MAG: hypothetical protein SNH94_05650 [Rikenellaceae bacterium]